jgi:hypothetical protein
MHAFSRFQGALKIGSIMYPNVETGVRKMGGMWAAAIRY